MSARDLGSAAAAAVVLLALLAGCDESPAQTALRVDIWNGDGTTAPAPPRPTSVTLSWLDDYGFLFKDKTFAVRDGTESYLGSVLVNVYVADLDHGPRRAIVRGQRDGTTISEGWGATAAVAGQAGPPIPIVLQAGADLQDADGDDVPDPIDSCPGVMNPGQEPGGC